MTYLSYNVKLENKKLLIQSPINGLWYSVSGRPLLLDNKIKAICKMVNFYGNQLKLSTDYIRNFSKYMRKEKNV